MNVGLMLKVADYIETHPENYDQRSWCGSQCCVAGTAVMLGDGFSSGLTLKQSYRVHTHIGTVDARIHLRARRLLDLDARTCLSLFYSAAVWPEPFSFQNCVEGCGCLCTHTNPNGHLMAAWYLRALVAAHQRYQAISAASLVDEELVLA